MIENPSEKSRKLLDDYEHGRITLADLNKECAYWYADCFEEVLPRPLPTMPQRFAEYQNSTVEEKKEYNNNFWQLPEIKSYLDQRESVKQENSDSLHKLREFLNYIPEEDFLTRRKYLDKISDFEARDFS